MTGEENGCGGKLLLEAPIVDPWVSMRSSILSAVASVLAGMELTVHLGMRRFGGASGCRASTAARVPNDARVPGSRVVQWRARARVHAVSASDLGRTLANDRGSTDRTQHSARLFFSTVDTGLLAGRYTRLLYAWVTTGVVYRATVESGATVYAWATYTESRPVQIL